MRLRALLEFSGGLATNFGLLMLAVLLLRLAGPFLLTDAHRLQWCVCDHVESVVLLFRNRRWQNEYGRAGQRG